MGIKGSIFVASMLAVSVVGCGSSKHSSSSTSTATDGGQTTVVAGTPTSGSFVRLDPQSNHQLNVFNKTVQLSAGSAQYLDGLCDIEVVGSKPATIIGAKVVVNPSSVSARVTSIHVSPRYASMAAAWNHAESGAVSYDPTEQIHVGFRPALGVLLESGFYNVTVGATLKVGAVRTVTVSPVLLYLQSGTRHATIACHSATEFDFAK